jgi:hypothetical protein
MQPTIYSYNWRTWPERIPEPDIYSYNWRTWPERIPEPDIYSKPALKPSYHTAAAAVKQST